MAKGGFLSSILAERHSSSTSGFAWRSLYYIYIGIPLLLVYYVIFHGLLTFLVQPLMTLLGFGFQSNYSERLQQIYIKLFTLDFNGAEADTLDLMLLIFKESWVLGFVKLGLVVAMYHLGALDYLLAPVYYITKV
jgi:hypothetical protein